MQGIVRVRVITVVSCIEAGYAVVVVVGDGESWQEPELTWLECELAS